MKQCREVDRALRNVSMGPRLTIWKINVFWDVAINFFILFTRPLSSLLLHLLVLSLHFIWGLRCINKQYSFLLLRHTLPITKCFRIIKCLHHSIGMSRVPAFQTLWTKSGMCLSSSAPQLICFLSSLNICSSNTRCSVSGIPLWYNRNMVNGRDSDP